MVLAGVLCNSKCIQNRTEHNRSMFANKNSLQLQKEIKTGYSVRRNLHGIQTHLSKLLLQCSEK